ncbi:MAG TPA: histidine kinase N-terminal 7TM domain-containing protein [Clostridia bacterium]|nr:histidine kinase N-terminal 7TM domain-containing protein [Clostridia bacterium]
MTLYSILYISYANITITILAVLAVLFWNRRHEPGARYMSLMMFSASLWGLGDFLSNLSVSYPAKIYLDRVSYLGVIAIPVAWLFFAIQFTKHDKYLMRKKTILLFIIPAISVLLLFTNDFHHLMIYDLGFEKVDQMVVLDTTYGFWFWIHAAYSYSLLLLGTVILAKRLAGLSQILRKQSVIILIAILIPLVMNILYTFRLCPTYPVDLTILSFSCTGYLCFFGMFRYRLFELVPAARNAVIEDMSGVLIVLDNKNHIIDMNSAAKNIIGITDRSYIGKFVFDILGDLKAYFVKYEHVSKAEEKICIRVNDHSKHYDLKITPLYDDKNKLIGKFLILYDITILEEAIENLKESRKASEAASKAKSEFLATMSHEIRTPLNGIIGMTELLTSSSHSEEEQEYLQTVKSSSSSLLDIVNDILDFSKIEAGKMELEKVEIDLASLLDSTAKSFAHKVKEKALEFTCSADNAIPGKLIGDTVRLRQVLVNLIGNAFKFTEKGRIEVKAALLSCENRQAVVEFSVSDTGIGIPEDKIASLFKSFQQVDSTTTRRYGGTGLGLAIVKRLVEMMNGRIEVESRLGRGSRFIVTVPFEISEKEAAMDAADTDISFNKDINILLVEDNRANQLLVKKLLEKKDVKVDIAGNGKEALSMLEAKEFNLILMDIQMPEMDGYEATVAIRRNESAVGRHTPIIALTANAAEDDKNACLQAGMDDYLSKPIRSENLYKCIHRHTVKCA